MIKKWLTVVAAGLLAAAIAYSPASTGSAEAADPPSVPHCGLGAVCW
ncbi:hypothetical protein GCM10009789_52370 [Kribbella sancticallisti]|uniref:Secreted protein n=1 Tax=Kribbella sancticallisti TaxID=460087 RepID=A0ABN2E0U7_9ACTN